MDYMWPYRVKYNASYLAPCFALEWDCRAFSELKVLFTWQKTEPPIRGMLQSLSSQHSGEANRTIGGVVSPAISILRHLPHGHDRSSDNMKVQKREQKWMWPERSNILAAWFTGHWTARFRGLLLLLFAVLNLCALFSRMRGCRMTTLLSICIRILSCLESFCIHLYQFDHPISKTQQKKRRKKRYAEKRCNMINSHKWFQQKRGKQNLGWTFAGNKDKLHRPTNICMSWWQCWPKLSKKQLLLNNTKEQRYNVNTLKESNH